MIEKLNDFYGWPGYMHIMIFVCVAFAEIIDMFL